MVQNPFTVEDKEIIKNSDVSKYLELTPNSCTYTKELMKKYTEHVWQRSITSQYQLEGYSSYPEVSCSKMTIPNSVPRVVETLFMSIFYQNNLMNSFLYKLNRGLVNTPKCSCNMEEDQDALHILTACGNIDRHKRQHLIQTLNNTNTCPDTEDHILLLNCSRDTDFVNWSLEIMSEATSFLRTDIQL